MKKLITIFVILIAVLAGALIAYKIIPQRKVIPESPALTQTVDEAADFTYYDFDGKEMKLSDLKGKSVVVNFWATWCYYCGVEMPHFQTAFEKYGEDVVFLMIDLTDNQSETPAAGKAFIEDAGYTFPVFYDLQGSAARAYNVISIPMTLFINSKGELVEQRIGAMDEDMLEKAIQDIL